MASRRDRIEAFLRKERQMDSLGTDGNVLYSYGTPIARWEASGVVKVFDGVWYSRTTSAQINLLRRLMREQGIYETP
jgi:hypothetical protein